MYSVYKYLKNLISHSKILGNGPGTINQLYKVPTLQEVTDKGAITDKDITLNSLFVNGNITFPHGTARTISMEDSPTGSGNALTIIGGRAAVGNFFTSSAINMTTQNGTTNPSGVGGGAGALTISTGVGGRGSTNGWYGGNVQIYTGSGGQGDNGSGGNAGAFTYSMGNGGASYGGNGASGGVGGGVTITTGNGGNQYNGTGFFSSGGASGSFSVTTGGGGSALNSSAGFPGGGASGAFAFRTGPGGGVSVAAGAVPFGVSGGASGALTFSTGAGGSDLADHATTPFTGGVTGNLTINTSNGGSASLLGTTNVGGGSGSLAITAGNGGLAQNGSVKNQGGQGGVLSLTSGSGGTGSATGAPPQQVGGNGGQVTITSGNGGVGATTGGTPGNIVIGAGNGATATSGANIFLYGGAKSGGASIDGNILLAWNGASRGSVGIGLGNVTARLHIMPGTATAGTAPLKLSSGVLNTTAEAGAIEFNADKYYATITTGPARKELTLNDVALTSGRVPFATTNGRLTDDASITYSTSTGLSTTKNIATIGRVTEAGTFAEIFVDNGVTAQTVATGTTYTKLTCFTTNGNSSNVTPDATNDKITMTIAGKYKVQGSFSFSGSANSNWRFALFNNGSEEGCIHLARKLGAGGDVGSASFSGIVAVTANTDIDVRVRHDSVGNEDITIQYSNLSIIYVGQ